MLRKGLRLPLTVQAVAHVVRVDAQDTPNLKKQKTFDHYKIGNLVGIGPVIFNWLITYFMCNLVDLCLPFELSQN